MAAHFHLWLCSENVCFGSLADILTSPRHVRFTPKSGHAQSWHQCAQSAKSGPKGEVSNST